jgi:hypothetical protein
MNRRAGFALLAFGVLGGSAGAQEGTIVYRLGNDTVAIEQFARTATRMTGEMVTRAGAAVQRVSYDLTLANGRITAAAMKRLNGDGTVPANTPNEYKFSFRADSATRTLVFNDSQPSRSFAAANAIPAFPVYVYAPFELLQMAKRDSAPAIPLAGGTVGYLGLARSGDTIRVRGGFYAMMMKFDAQNRLQSTDGFFTTNKAMGTRGSGKMDIAAVAKAMKPTGTLSPRQTAYASFAQGPITINYGSPAVRGRTVWGGTLIPLDTIWRTGANEAAHLATSKTIQLGEMTIAPGLYTIWTQHKADGTWLIVNKQVGQWGTGYNPANDVGRVQMTLANTPEHVEDFTITIRSLGGPRGAIDLAWGDKVATATFQVRP